MILIVATYIYIYIYIVAVNSLLSTTNYWKLLCLVSKHQIYHTIVVSWLAIHYTKPT